MIRISWDGHYLDGKTADRQAVQIHLAGDGLKIIKDNGETLSWPYGEIRQVQGFYQNESRVGGAWLGNYDLFRR